MAAKGPRREVGGGGVKHVFLPSMNLLIFMLFLNASNLTGENGLTFPRYTMSGQNSPVRSQYQSMNEIGSLHSRSAGFKHQGGGCALGSFLWGGGGHGKGGERKRSRSGGQNVGQVSFECSQVVVPALRSETSTPSRRLFVRWILC